MKEQLPSPSPQIHPTKNRLVLFLALSAGLLLPSSAKTQELAQYGKLLQVYVAENAALESKFMKDLAKLRAQNASLNARREAVKKFMERSQQLAKNKRYVVQKKLIDETNRRLAEADQRTGRTKPNTTGKGNQPINVDPIKPNTRIKQSMGSPPWSRGRTGDLDASGGSRAVRIATEVAQEMGLNNTAMDDFLNTMKKNPPATQNQFFEKLSSYITVEKNFNMTLFNERGGGHGVVGSQSHATAIEVGAIEKETSLHGAMKKNQAGRSQVETLDHMTKAESGRYAKTTDLIPTGGDRSNPLKSIDFVKGERLQGLLKGTLKSIGSAGITNLELASIIKNNKLNMTPDQFRNLLNEGKGGMAFFPDSFEAGDFMDESRMHQLKKACDDVLTIAEAKTESLGREQLKQAKEQVRILEKTGQQQAAHELKSQIIDSEKRILELQRNNFKGEIDRITVEKTRLNGELKVAKRNQDNARVKAIESEIRKLNNKVNQIYERQVNSDMRHELLKRKMVSAQGAATELGKEPVKTPRKSPGKPANNSPIAAPIEEPTRLPIFRRIANSQTMKTIGQGGLLSAPPVSLIFSWGREKLESKAEGREFSHNRVGFNALADILWFNQAWTFSQQGVYEWNKGHQDYLRDQIRRDIERRRREGESEYSVVDDLYLGAKTLGRRVALTTYNFSKTIPLVGMPMMTGEMIVHTGISSYEKWQDIETWRRAKIQDLHQVEKSADTAKGILDRVKGIVADEAKIIKEAAAITSMIANIQTDIENRVELHRQDIQTLETLIEKSESDGGSDFPDLEKDDLDLSGMRSSIDSVTQHSNSIYALADRILKRHGSLKVTKEDAAGRFKGLSNQFAKIEIQADEFRATIDSLYRVIKFAEADTTEQPSNQAPILAKKVSESRKLIASYLSAAQEGLNNLRVLQKNHQTLNKMLESERRLFSLLDDRWGTRTENGSAAEKTFQTVRQSIKSLRIAPERMKPFMEKIPDLILVGNRARKKIEMNIPELPAELVLLDKQPQIQRTLSDLNSPLIRMDESLDRTREKLKQLQSLVSPGDFSVKIVPVAKSPLEFIFNLRPKNAPQGKKIIYRWRFGDETSDSSNDTSISHKFKSPGTYTVRVSATHSTETFSELLGESEVKVVVASPTNTIPAPIPKNKIVHKGDYTINAVIGDWESKDGNATLEIFPESGTFKTSFPQSFHKGLKLGETTPTTIIFGSKPENYSPQKNYSFVAKYNIYVSISDYEGTIDLKTGRFAGRSVNVQIQESLSANYFGPGVTLDDKGRISKMSHVFSHPANKGKLILPGGTSNAHKILGFNPQKTDFTGKMTGNLDLKRNGGSMRVNAPKMEPKSFSGKPEGQIGFGVSFSKTLVPFEFRSKGITRQLYAMVMPSTEQAKNWMVENFGSGFKKIDIGDEAYWTNRRTSSPFGMRFGRVVIKGVSGRPQQEEMTRKQLEHCLDVIKTSKLMKDLKDGMW